MPGFPSRGGSMLQGQDCRTPAIATAEYAEYAEAAVSRSVRCGSTRGRRVWKPATRQTWKSAPRRPDSLNGCPPHSKGSRPIRKGPWSFRQVLECGGKAKPRRRSPTRNSIPHAPSVGHRHTGGQSGVALRFPPHSKGWRPIRRGPLSLHQVLERGGKAKPRHRFPIRNPIPRAPSVGHRHTGGQSGVALRFPPHSKGSARFGAAGSSRCGDRACLCAGLNFTRQYPVISQPPPEAREAREGRHLCRMACPARMRPVRAGICGVRGDAAPDGARKGVVGAVSTKMPFPRNWKTFGIAVSTSALTGAGRFASRTVLQALRGLGDQYSRLSSHDRFGKASRAAERSRKHTVRRPLAPNTRHNVLPSSVANGDCLADMPRLLLAPEVSQELKGENAL